MCEGQGRRMGGRGGIHSRDDESHVEEGKEF